MRVFMPRSLSSSPTGVAPQTTAARQTLTALQNTLTRIGNANADPTLRPLIAEGFSRCAQLEQYFDHYFACTSGSHGIVDLQVFERLMLLAGPETARELLDQLRADLGSAQTALVAATQPGDWTAVRAQCHVLIAIAGSIGATSLQHEAERLQAAIHQADPVEIARLTTSLQVRLAVLISFVQAERLTRAAP
jgi:HPt (histidine-containing phosphotransfer) domain-containing protein